MAWTFGVDRRSEPGCKEARVAGIGSDRRCRNSCLKCGPRGTQHHWWSAIDRVSHSQDRLDELDNLRLDIAREMVAPSLFSDLVEALLWRVPPSEADAAPPGRAKPMGSTVR